MTSFRIFETAEFQAALSRLDPGQKRLVEARLKDGIYPQLRLQPYYGTNIRKLRNYQPETWRYRIGRYRIFYGIDAEEHRVDMLTIDHRKDAYR